ncbi:MAG: tryptophan 7-halogenase [Actinobacteria bacterium]|nr:tryptophan 7-halogenase [Actinomycetota bacterium]
MSNGHAVVIGGSISGLTAACALSESFERVTVVERDRLPDGPGHRKGVPQARQLHVVLPLGVRVLDSLFPGFERELREAGCPVFDEVRDTPWFGAQGWRARSASDVYLFGFSRPLFEHLLRERVRATGNVQIVEGMVDGLRAAEGGERVSGVEFSGSTAAGIEADLVVDASGRGSKAPRWLEQLGYERPAEQHVRAHFGYASRLVKVPEGAMPDGLDGLITMPFPGHSKGGLILPADNGRHTLCCIGAAKDYPPGDEEGFYEYLRQAPSPLLAEIAKQCEPDTEIATYHHPGNQLRLWSRLARRPRRFIPIGDAVASFNPIYGQGMTVAALEALKLRDRIASLDGNLDPLADEFQADLTAAVEFPYGMATQADSAYPETEYVDAEPAPAEALQFFATVEQVATEDPEVARDILRATGWFDAELLASPTLVAKAQAWAASGKTVRNNDPAQVPPVTPAPQQEVLS